VDHLSDAELIQLLIGGLAVAALLRLPACIRAWKRWHTKNARAGDPITPPWAA